MQYLVKYWTSLLLVVCVAYVVNPATLCEDKTQSCDKWFEKNLCNENSKYRKQRFYVSMARLCKKSCRMCGDDDYELVDSDARCNYYSKKGYCDQVPHQGFMLRRCKYSCRSTIRHGVTSRGRGNFQRDDSPDVVEQQRRIQQRQKQQQQQPQNAWQADRTNPLHWGRQYAQQYAHQYGYPYGQQYSQYAQQNGQQYPQQNGQQYPQYAAQQYGQQYAQQNDALPQQQQQQPQQQQQQQQQQQPSDQSILSLPVQVQALSKLHNAKSGAVGEPGKQKLDKKHDIQP